MKQIIDPNKSSPLLSDELKLLQITKLFLNSFKDPKSKGQFLSLVNATAEDNFLDQDIPHSPNQEAQLESAFSASSNYLILKS